ncbi:MAG: alpha/beta fold hydrolase [bacterium]|nr:alpha/beta fold hydrolase [bacterium]
MLLELTLTALAAVSNPVPAVPTAAAPARTGALPADDTKDDVGESIKLKTRDRLELSATFYPPRSKKGRAPAALLVHDAGGDRSQLTALALHLRKYGFGVLAVDLRGHGESATTEVAWETSDEKARQTLWALSSRDMRAAANYLREQPTIHASNLTLIGHGAGCSLAVRHALDDENARAVVLLSPQPETLGFNMVHGIGDLEGLPTQMVVGKDAREAAVRVQQAAQKANEGLEYVTVSTVKTANAKLLSDKKVTKSVYSWLRENVLPKK